MENGSSRRPAQISKERSLNKFRGGIRENFDFKNAFVNFQNRYVAYRVAPLNNANVKQRKCPNAKIDRLKLNINAGFSECDFFSMSCLL